MSLILILVLAWFFFILSFAIPFNFSVIPTSHSFSCSFHPIILQEMSSFSFPFYKAKLRVFLQRSKEGKPSVEHGSKIQYQTVLSSQYSEVFLLFHIMIMLDYQNTKKQEFQPCKQHLLARNKHVNIWNKYVYLSRFSYLFSNYQQIMIYYTLFQW